MQSAQNSAAAFALIGDRIIIVAFNFREETPMSKSKDTKKEAKKKPKLSLKEKRQLKKSKTAG